MRITKLENLRNQHDNYEKHRNCKNLHDNNENHETLRNLYIKKNKLCKS